MKVSEDNWQQLLDLLDRYLELPEAAREALLASTDAAAPARGAMLRQLIRDFDAGALLSAQDFLAPQRPRRPRILHSGRIIGRYRLTRVIGRGAMSAAWLAEQRGFSAARAVALKFFFASSRTMQDRERLGALHHPGIARLLDAGVSDDAQPYLVWEFVDGQPLLKYAAAERLSVGRRVALFVEVLYSLGYAHAHLILHGSLKPSNVLVDAAGVPHLLDIGTSSYPPGRSDYNSPEQILGESPSTACDVYSAGVLLYEVLTGQRPYRLTNEVGSGRADAILAARAPALASAANAAQAAACGCTLRDLRRLLGADLDAIVQRALAKDPAQRYASADSFAQDLGRWLRRERVSARRDSVGYRVATFLRRNPLVAGAAAIVLLALTLSLAVAVGQTRAARHEAARSAALSAFLAGLFDNPEHRAGPTAAELLEGGLKSVHEELGAFPEAEIEALDTLANLYARIGEADGASRAMAARLALLEQRYGAGDGRVIDAALDAAGQLLEGGRASQAAELLGKARAALDAHHDTDSPRRARLLLESSRAARYGAVSDSSGLADEAVDLLSRHDPQERLVAALRESAEAKALLGALVAARDTLLRAAGNAELRHPGDERWREGPLCELAGVQAQLLELDDADAKFRDCMALVRRVAGTDGVLTGRRELAYARFLQDTGRAEQARALLDAPARASTDFWRQDGLVQTALEAGRLDEARQRLERYLPLVRQRQPRSLLTARASLQQATLLTTAGQFAEAATLENSALVEARRSLGERRDAAALNGLLLAAVRLDLARGAPADALERLPDVHEAGSVAGPSPDRLEAQLLHARALLAMERAEAAQPEAAAMLDNLRRSPLHGYLTRLEADASLALAQMQITAERYVEAQLHAERALSLRQASQDAKSLGLFEVEIVLARSLIAQRQFPLAQRQLSDAAALLAGQPGAGPQYGAALSSASDELARALHPPKAKHR